MRSKWHTACRESGRGRWAGEVDPWRARRVAETTIRASPRLSREAAAWVDGQVAGFLARVGPAQVERLVAEAVTRFDLTERTETSAELVERLHVTLDLDHALRAGARALTALGSTEPLGARRSRALGQLARAQTALDLFAADDAHARNEGAQPDEAHDAVTTVAVPVARAWEARRLDLHLHFDATTTTEGVEVSPVGRLENGQRLVLHEKVKQWCRDAHSEVRVLSVLDLADELSTSGCAPTPHSRVRSGCATVPVPSPGAQQVCSHQRP